MFQAKQQYLCLIAFLWPLLMNLWPRLTFQNQASLLALYFSFVFLELKKKKKNQNPLPASKNTCVLLYFYLFMYYICQIRL